MKVAVLGANGAVGARIVTTLSGRGHDVVRVGRRAAADDRLVYLGAADKSEYVSAIADVDTVINASGLEDPALAQQAGTARFVDISATAGYLEKIIAAPAAGGVLAFVGLAPGLTTLMAGELPAESGDHIDVALTLGTGERHGRAAVEWTAGLLGTKFPDGASNAMIRNLTRPRTIEGPPGSRKRFVRADFPDHLVAGEDGRLIENYLALSSAVATWSLRAASLLPAVGGPMLRRLHLPGTDEWSVLIRNRTTGRWSHTSGHNQSEATATMTVAAVEAAENRIDPVLFTTDVLESHGLTHWDIHIRTGR
ncbi:NAD-dependent epimerase/dehydratase family protein [Williamsia limnetica]|uniref:NAD-dependent epimerase/dehydratase family protein n=1 Tax=Williamsia limnetica TaxID=882452 RepID=A0A318RNM2_WILLI|nr:NAD-dependent epimerase/dehydratase family protein [Williamsia limnetica]PYE19191.1 NAD-dependent epimerase/dehydratase family protein [Williamsia limnetica]